MEFTLHPGIAKYKSMQYLSIHPSSLQKHVFMYAEVLSNVSKINCISLILPKGMYDVHHFQVISFNYCKIKYAHYYTNQTQEQFLILVASFFEKFVLQVGSVMEIERCVDVR